MSQHYLKLSLFFIRLTIDFNYIKKNELIVIVNVL